MRARSILTALAISALVLGAMAPAGAAPAVAVDNASRNGASATVSGTATFPAITAAQDIGGFKTVGQPAGIGDNAGLNLTRGEILPLANNSGLRFTWKVASLPQEIPPEGVRYNWAFQIGSRIYQLQAKRTNLVNATTTEDPVGHAQHALNGGTNQQWFQLRGACVANYPVPESPIQGCYHLAFLNGSFDIPGGKISIDLPYETRDSIGRLVAPDFKPGAVLRDNLGVGSAGMTIAASFQAVVSNTTTSQYINEVNPYYVGPQVSLGVGPANAAPDAVTYSAPATLTAGTWSGTVSGLSAGNTTVYVRACHGTECSYTSVTP